MDSLTEHLSWVAYLSSKTRKRFEELFEKVSSHLKNKDETSLNELPSDCRLLRYWTEKLRKEEPQTFLQIKKEYMLLNSQVGQKLHDDYLKYLARAKKHRKGTKVRLKEILRYVYYYGNYVHECLLEGGAGDSAKKILRNFWDVFGKELMKYRDILDDLLFCARAGIGKTELGEWWITVDTLDISIMSLGDNDGYYDNANIKDVSITPSNNALKTAFIHYDVSISNDRALKEISLPIHTTFGIDKIYTLPFVAEDDTAKKVLSYIYGRSIYAEKMASVIAGMQGRDLRRGKIVSLTKTSRNLSAEDFKIDRITRKAAGSDLDCRSYDPYIYGDQTISAPVVPSFDGVVSTDPRNLPDLATTDPLIEGVLWNDSGTIKISAGP